MKSLYKLIRESGVSISTFVYISVLASLSSLITALPPHFVGAAINAIVGGGVHGQHTDFSPIHYLNQSLKWAVETFSFSPVILFLTLFFFATFAQLVVRNVFAVYVSIFADKFILFIRKKCFDKILRGKKSDLEHFDSGELVHRVMNDTMQLNSLIGTPIYMLCSDILDLLWLSAIIIMIDWKILVILISIIPFLYFVSKKTGKFQKECADTIQRNEAVCTGFIQRSVLGIDAVKASQGENRETKEFTKLIDNNFVIRKKASINLGFFFPQEGVLRAIGTIGVIAYISFLSTKDVTYIGTIPVLLIYTNKFYAPLGTWARYYQTIQKALVSFKRLQEILMLREENVLRQAPAVLGKVLPLEVKGAITLESGNIVPLCVRTENPKLIILKGKSGVGKTRLIKSLIGLGNKFEGKLKLGNIPIEGHRHIRNHVALASQDGHFIPGTIAENLSYPMTDAKEEKCLEILEALGLEYKLNHPVAEYGRNLSIGEQRRLIFGRAIYSDKPIMILDEIDANVDEETRSQLYRIIRHEMNKKLIIMTSHVHTTELNGTGSIGITIIQEAV